jgi:rod shape-determining protein MreC
MQKRFKTFFNITIVILVTVFLHYFGWLSPIENFFRTLVSPFSKAMYTASTNLTTDEINKLSLEDLRNTYQKLLTEKLDLEVKAVQADTCTFELTELKKQLKFVQSSNYQTIGAEVIGKNIDSLNNNIIIDCGSLNGCQIGNPVIVDQGVLIGKIARTEEKISIVRLINDNQSKVAATVNNKDGSLGLVEGGYGISISLNYIPQNESLSVGDMVITSGLEVDMPRGLLLGAVEAIEKEAYQPFQSAILKPSVNLDKILLVSVITNSTR